MFVSWKVKFFFSPNMCSTRYCEWKIIGEILESSIKNNSKSHFLEEIFRPADSKSLRTKMTTFEMELNHGD